MSAQRLSCPLLMALRIGLGLDQHLTVIFLVFKIQNKPSRTSMASITVWMAGMVFQGR